MNDLAIAYYEYSQKITYDRNTFKFVKGNGEEMIRTVGGELYSHDAWMQQALAFVKKSGQIDLYVQVRKYIVKNCLWLKKEEIIEHALDCFLHESYKKWDDFTYQEKLKI